MNTQTNQVESGIKTSPKDFFLHLLSIVALYASSISFLVFAFQCVNVFFPDVLQGGYYNSLSSYESIRWAIAMLIVFFPTYIGTGVFLNKEYAKEPEKKNLRVRKWLLHFTLFVAALIILGDLVALILNFMRGELTVRFLLKVLSVFFVAGSVFGYYLWELKNSEFSKRVKSFIYAMCAVVLATVVCGFIIAGSPKEERARRFDERRISDLQMIQSEIVEYWRSKQALPEHLDALNNPIRGFVVPKDPETSGVYVYKVKSGNTFELCAIFSGKSLIGRKTNEMPRTVYDRYSGWGNVWEHEAGEWCFERIIDKDLYPPLYPPKI